MPFHVSGNSRGDRDKERARTGRTRTEWKQECLFLRAFLLVQTSKVSIVLMLSAISLTSLQRNDQFPEIMAVTSRTCCDATIPRCTMSSLSHTRVKEQKSVVVNLLTRSLANAKGFNVCVCVCGGAHTGLCVTANTSTSCGRNCLAPVKNSHFPFPAHSDTSRG